MKTKARYLNENWIWVQELWTKEEQKEVLIQVREPSFPSGRLGKVLEEYTEIRSLLNDIPVSRIYIFNKKHYELMQINYKMGTGGDNPSEKSHIRYSDTWTDGKEWYGNPEKTAKAMLSQGVPVPKELYSLFAHAIDNVY